MIDSIEMTTGEMAQAYGVPRYRLDYVIESRQISPCRRQGIVRLFEQVGQDEIREEINRITRRRVRPIDLTATTELGAE